MARLHEYESKALLKEHGFHVPKGGPASSPEAARQLAESLDCPVVVKVQAWTTSRKAQGGIVLASTALEAEEAAERLLSKRFGNFPVTHVLVEEQVPIADELFVSLIIDDANRQPVILLSASGGAGVEERAAQVHRLACDVEEGPNRDDILLVLQDSAIHAELHEPLADAVQQVFLVAKKYEARSLEINPLVTTIDGRPVAVDCRMTIDDYAVFRHPELGIDIARELDHPPTPLERVAYEVEQADHRGTFYFAQLHADAAPDSRGLIGFHGAGGGGSMMSMDAIVAEGFTIANFCDTSGNPSAAKVYRAARIILSQPDLVGYFGSGSGVASQEQFWSAYGLAKAFWELELSIPALVRLGGNSEDRAVDILQDACCELPATVEGYRKDDSPRQIAERFAELVAQADGSTWQPRSPRKPCFVGSATSIDFADGKLWIDSAACDRETTALVVQHGFGLFHISEGKPALAVAESDLIGKDSELIGLEVELRRAGKPVVFVELDVPGLDIRRAADKNIPT